MRVILLGGVATHGICLAASERTVTVQLFTGRSMKSVHIASPGGHLQSSTGAQPRVMGPRARRFEAAGDRVKAHGDGSGGLVAAGFTIRGKDLTVVTRVSPDGSDARAFRGSIAVRAHNGRLVLVNWVPLESYLRSVVPLELSVDAPEAALRAQAIAARCYSVAARGRHPNMPYELCDQPHCQLYLGVRSESLRSDAAVKATEGQVLVHAGKVIEAPFHSCCGGATSAIEDVWRGGSPVPYLSGGSDIGPDGAYCRRSPQFRWEFRVSGSALLRALRASTSADPGAQLKSIQVLKRDGGGRALEVEIVGTRRAIVTGGEMRSLLGRALGPDKLRSTRFVVGRRGDEYVFEGTGYGHGIGMCHWGAMGRAEAGETHEQILRHYYPGTTLGSL